MQILFFDGTCVLCNDTALKIAQLNVDGNIHFAAFQSKLAQEKILTLNQKLDSIVFLDKDKVFIKSEAVFEVLKYLPTVKWLRIFRILPLKLRDKIYDWVAVNRIKWFGRQDTCKRVPLAFKDRYVTE